MKIEVNYNELYNLGDYMEKMFEELKKDFDEINLISESLNQVLQGSAEQTISTRMKDFNSTQFSQIVNYTHLLGNEVINCAKSYNAEDDEFAQKMKHEASRYGVDSSSFISDTRYKTSSTTSGLINSGVQTSSSKATSVSNSNSTLNYSNETFEKKNDGNQQGNEKNTLNDDFNNVLNGSDESNPNIAQSIDGDVKKEVPDTANISTDGINDSAINIKSSRSNSSKSKGMFSSFFGAVATAMGFKTAKNKKDKINSNNEK